MTTAHTTETVVSQPEGRPLLPDNPFMGLHYHFGMLLGVDDLETEQGFHHGKMRLHNAWLHRAGVVWGLGVEADPETREIKVAPGFALDPAGHELYVERLMCVDVGAWYDNNADAVTVMPTDNGVTFQARVEIAYRPCLTRPVPALAEPCVGAGDGGSDGTAYSRVFEAVEVCLVPDSAEPVIAPYHRLRLFFGLDEPWRDASGEIADADAEVIAERNRIAALSEDARPGACLAAFRALGALDVAELSPGVDERGNPLVLYPATEFAPVVLANVDVTLVGSTGDWTMTDAEVDIGVRPLHVATSTTQELLCRACAGEAPGTGETGSGPAPGTGAVPGTGGTPGPETPPVSGGTPTAASGPQVVAVERGAGTTLILKTDAPLAKRSVSKDSFTVTVFTSARGWANRRVARVRLAAGNTEVTLTLDDVPSGEVIRVVASGSGRWPLLGEDHAPLAGSRGDPPGPIGGHDSVYHLEGSA